MTPSRDPPVRNATNLKGYLKGSLLLLLIGNASAEKPGEVCTNPDKVQGTCIEIRSCPPLLNVLKTKPLPSDTVAFLRKSQCGVLEGQPLVCCPPDPQAHNVTDPRLDFAEDEVMEDVSRHRNLGLLRMDICGPSIQSSIHLGHGVHLGELPWMALVEYVVQSGYPFKCGGSLINERYVLTAAHCVTGGRHLPVSVRLGEHNLASPTDCEGDGIEGNIDCAPVPEDIPVEKIIAHPKYVGKPNFQYDIALLRLSRPVNFTETVLPICLPIESNLQQLDLDGKYLTAAGWGISTGGVEPNSEVRKWTMSVVPHAQCSQEFRGVTSISNVSQICAEANAREACSGDSGGPLTRTSSIQSIQNGYRVIQHGILSYGKIFCGVTPNVWVYTRVDQFMKWILDTIEP